MVLQWSFNSRVLDYKVWYIISPLQQHTSRPSQAVLQTAHACLQMQWGTNTQLSSSGAIFNDILSKAFPQDMQTWERRIICKLSCNSLCLFIITGIIIDAPTSKRHFRHYSHFAYHHLNTTATFNL